MGRVKSPVFAFWATAAACAAGAICILPAHAGEAGAELMERETILDRKVSIHDGVAEVPQVPPLCDSLALDRRRINIGDCVLYCEIEGHGPALALINGGPGGTHHDFHPHFKRAADFARVVYYDQRGCGNSDYSGGAEGYSIEQAADDLDRLRAALELEKWTVLGWSYGGVVAQTYVLKYPERVSGLVLVGSATEGHRIALGPTRQYDYISEAERKKIAELCKLNLPLPQLVYNMHLNGDWKRQGFYRPSAEDLARMAHYGWKHDPVFRQRICSQLGMVDFGGMFENCPIPVLLLEGRYDLTWAADKPKKFHACFPGSVLVMFERAAHAPFADEPEKFFGALRDFIEALPSQSAGAMEEWKKRIAACKSRPEYFLRNLGYGRRASAKIAEQYSDAWLEQISEPYLLLKLGQALMDTGRHAEALAVFQKMAALCDKDDATRFIALVWEGHMLDLLGDRDQAVAIYKKALEIGKGGNWRHDQYGLVINRAYVRERLGAAFKGAKNSED